MSWEESHRKEQIFRKKRINREITLKTVEEPDGNISLIFSLRSDNVFAEINLTVEEWKSILSFLNKTSQRILQDISKKGEKISLIPVAEPLPESDVEATMKSITESTAEPAVIKPETLEVEKQDDSESIPIPEELFKELEVEMQKGSSLSSNFIPVVRSEEVITEIAKTSPEESKVAMEEPTMKEKVPLEESDLKLSAEDIQEELRREEAESIDIEALKSEIILESEIESDTSTIPFQGSEKIETSEEDLEATPPVPKLHKIPQATKEELESLLTPIQQPKISGVDEFEKEETPKPVPTETQIPETTPEISSTSPAPQITAKDLLDATQTQKSPIETQEPIFAPGEEGEQLDTDEKEAKILAAMEEVASLLPPGPAKRFVEEMMLKRTAYSNREQPRIPQKNNVTNDNSEN